jgi:GNAT superfamily N-acetyltransferase
VKVETRDLTPQLWPDFERLFGPNGACAGCWCMWWRNGPGERISLADGPRMKKRQKELVQSGASRGVLAFADGAPVGWCAYGRLDEFPRLQRSPALACDDGEGVWSIPCFFVRAGFRGRGVARALLRHALRSIASAGGRIAEAYPVRLPATNAAAFTGTVPFLESEGFVTLTARPRGRQRARRALI